MDSGWIKLYRKILQNDALFRSAHTFTIWCWLLLMADRNTGIVTCGRNQISTWLKIKPSTVYLTLKRLENLTMIKLKPNNKMTTVLILNWHTYQSKPDNKITTNQQQDNTIQEVRSKNKETRIQEEEKEKIPNRLLINRSQHLVFLKEFPGLTTAELKEQITKCNSYMVMSSQNYNNPGLFFKGWLNKYMEDTKMKKQHVLANTPVNAPIVSEEQRLKNMDKIKQIKATLREKFLV